MKKQLFIISVLVIIVSIFVSCSVNSSSDEISTTAVTDNNGTTHYYEPITDDKGNVSTTAKNQGVFAEIETQSNGKTVTNKNGTYVTNEHTTVLPIETGSDNTSSTTKPGKITASDTTKDTDKADNDIPFETSSEKEPQHTKTTDTDETDKNKESTSNDNTATKVVTDKDGWIDKWY